MPIKIQGTRIQASEQLLDKLLLPIEHLEPPVEPIKNARTLSQQASIEMYKEWLTLFEAEIVSYVGQPDTTSALQEGHHQIEIDRSRICLVDFQQNFEAFSNALNDNEVVYHYTQGDMEAATQSLTFMKIYQSFEQAGTPISLQELRATYRDDQGHLCGFCFIYLHNNPQCWIMSIDRNPKGTIPKHQNFTYYLSPLFAESKDQYFGSAQFSKELTASLGSEKVAQLISNLIDKNDIVSEKSFNALSQRFIPGYNIDRRDNKSRVLHQLIELAKDVLPQQYTLWQTFLEKAERDIDFFKEDRFKASLQTILTALDKALGPEALKQQLSTLLEDKNQLDNYLALINQQLFNELLTDLTPILSTRKNRWLTKFQDKAKQDADFFKPGIFEHHLKLFLKKIISYASEDLETCKQYSFEYYRLSKLSSLEAPDCYPALQMALEKHEAAFQNLALSIALREIKPFQRFFMREISPLLASAIFIGVIVCASLALAMILPISLPMAASLVTVGAVCLMIATGFMISDEKRKQREIRYQEQRLFASPPPKTQILKAPVSPNTEAIREAPQFP